MSFLLDWFWDVLLRLGLWQKEAKLIVVGLDNAGKTTLLHRLKEGRVGRFAPTQRPREEQLEVGTVRIAAFDLGGHRAVRELWSDYCARVDAVVYMVDLSDEARLEESGEEFRALLRDVPKTMRVLVLGNKCDKQRLVDVERLKQLFELDEAAERVHALQFFRTSLYNGNGVQESMKWLEQNL